MNIKRMPAQIAGIKELSPAAREVTLKLPEPLGFLPGAFVNVFMDHEGQRLRRAYSLSSTEKDQDNITLSIRKGSVGGMSERFWDDGIENVPLDIMGPLGLNTIDKIENSRVFLMGFGIGAGVIKGLVQDLLARKDVAEVSILTGSRNEDDILYKDFFEKLAAEDPRLRLRFVVSRPHDPNYPFRGYLQDHVSDLDFQDATVYICGAKEAAESLRDVILKKETVPPQFLIEAFD